MDLDSSGRFLHKNPYQLLARTEDTRLVGKPIADWRQSLGTKEQVKVFITFPLISRFS
jgi:hypothetical protein